MSVFVFGRDPPRRCIADIRLALSSRADRTISRMTYAGDVHPSAAIRILLIAAVYTVIARLGLMLGAVSGFATLVWPPSGIAIVALWRYGYRTWPAITIGAFLVNVWTGAPIAA